MNPPRLVAAVCIVLAVLALAYALISDPQRIDPGSPRTAAGKIPLLAASVPPIGDFEREFNVNIENPFVPYEVRVAANEVIRNPPRPNTGQGPKPPPPQGPVTVPEPAKPQYPKLKSGVVGAPECLGVIRKGDVAVVVARLPDQDKVNVEVGQSIGGWTLREVGRGVATFTDPTGADYELPVGGTTVPQTLNESAAPATSAAEPVVSDPAAPAAERPVLRPGQQPARTGTPPQAGMGMTPQPAPEMVPLRPRPR